MGLSASRLLMLLLARQTCCFWRGGWQPQKTSPPPPRSQSRRSDWRRGSAICPSTRLHSTPGQEILQHRRLNMKFRAGIVLSTVDLTVSLFVCTSENLASRHTHTRLDKLLLFLIDNRCVVMQIAWHDTIFSLFTTKIGKCDAAWKKKGGKWKKTESEQRQPLALKEVTIETVLFFPLLDLIWSGTFTSNSGNKLAPPTPLGFCESAILQEMFL